MCCLKNVVIFIQTMINITMHVNISNFILHTVNNKSTKPFKGKFNLCNSCITFQNLVMMKLSKFVIITEKQFKKAIFMCSLNRPWQIAYVELDLLEIMNFTNCCIWLFFNKYALKHTFNSVLWACEATFNNIHVDIHVL